MDISSQQEEVRLFLLPCRTFLRRSYGPIQRMDPLADGPLERFRLCLGDGAPCRLFSCVVPGVGRVVVARGVAAIFFSRLLHCSGVEGKV